MKNDLQIPPWLKEKTREYSVEDKKSGRLFIALITSAIAGYIGLTILERNQHDEKTVRQANTVNKLDGSDSNTDAPSDSRNTNTSIPKIITEHDLHGLQGNLVVLYHYMQSDHPEDACKKIPEGFRMDFITRPSKYGTTYCLAKAGQALYEKTGDVNYLSIAAYYYRRCLYLIDGQLDGKFIKPKGGVDEIEKRREKVFKELANISKQEG